MSANGEPAGAVDAAPVSRRTKRAAVAAVWAVTTAFLAAVGWVAGANAGETPVTLFGLVPVPDGPGALALVAVLVGNVALAAVAGVIAVAARRDRERTGGGDGA